MGDTFPSFQKKRASWVSVVGARPQFIKAAPVCGAIKAHNQAGREPVIGHRIIHTGQHYDRDMTEVFFTQLGIPEPQYNLHVGSGSHGEQLAKILERLEAVIRYEPLDWLIVYGDTNSTLAGALVAARLGIPAVHVEAGCRSYNRRMPEEQNRVLADHLSQLLLAPTQSAVENLWREGIGVSLDPLRRRVACVGDIMYDALVSHISLAERNAQAILKRFGLKSGHYYLLTLHRAENTDRPEVLQSILLTLEGLDLPVLFPAHPRTRNVLSKSKVSWKSGKVRMVRPLGYLDMLAAEKHARKILTDSGGVQKEAFYLKIPCVTLREETEWPETVANGANCVAGTDRDRVLEAVHKPLPDFEAMTSPFGDGRACDRVMDELLMTRSQASQVCSGRGARDMSGATLQHGGFLRGRRATVSSRGNGD
jgi:UDP-GlcNAc3NAcA epimerase